MTLNLTANQALCLAAVRDGHVRHIHPFTFVVPATLLDIPRHQRLLLGLERRKLLVVEAASAEYHRPVLVTTLGEEALLAYAADVPKTATNVRDVTRAFLAGQPGRSAAVVTDGNALWWEGEQRHGRVCLLTRALDGMLLLNHRDEDRGLAGRASRGAIRRAIHAIPHVEVHVDPMESDPVKLVQEDFRTRGRL